MELIYTNDLCTGCNKCVRGCPVLTANIATQEGYVTVDPDKCIACGETTSITSHYFACCISTSCINSQ